MKTVIRALLVPTLAALALVVPAPAQATAGWTTLYYDTAGPAADDIRVLACKRAVDGAFGPLWQIDLVVISARNWRATATATIQRSGSTVGGEERVSAVNGAWGTGRIHASRVLSDRLVVHINQSQISPVASFGGTLAPVKPASLVSC